MNDAIRAAQQAYHPATFRLPVTFDYPLGGIVGRTAIGIALLAIGGVLLLQSDAVWMVGAALFGLMGVVVTASNLCALIDADRRRIVIDQDGVEIRYGFSRRHYRFLDYSDYRITRLGFRRFLAALPIELSRSLGERAERTRITIYDRPAFLTPMPVLGGGAPATLLEWQSTLNELRRAAIAAAGLSEDTQRESQEASAEEARRAAQWLARERTGAKPSRLSRRAYLRGRMILALIFLVLLVTPMAFVTAVRQELIVVCVTADESGCINLDRGLRQALMIGMPLLAVLVFALGHAHLMVRRAHDLDEDLSFRKAALNLLSRGSGLRRRLGREIGIAGTNRFGPIPPE